MPCFNLVYLLQSNVPMCSEGFRCISSELGCTVIICVSSCTGVLYRAWFAMSTILKLTLVNLAPVFRYMCGPFMIESAGNRMACLVRYTVFDRWLYSMSIFEDYEPSGCETLTSSDANL